MTTTTKDPQTHSGAWTNGAGGKTKDDSQWAHTSTNSDIHRYEDYGFSLTGETITKVEVGIEFYCESNESVQLRISTDNGSTWSDWSNKFTLTSEDIIWVDFTSYQETWSPSDLDDDHLLVEIQFKKGGGAGCFAPDTLITMADGSQKPIKDVKLGDKVLSKDGVATVTAKTTHKSLHAKYLLVKFKDVTLVPTHLVRERDGWYNLPPKLPVVKLKEVINIETDTGSLYANNILFHNVEKEAWTAYLDWIPVRVTHQGAVTEKDFSDTGGGSDGFLNAYRAMGFNEAGGGSDAFGIGFKSLGFAVTGGGADAFTNPFRAMGFAETGGGADVFKLLREMGFSDVGAAADVFAKQLLGAIAKAFSDSGSGTDVFGKAITCLNKAFNDSGAGTDVFALVYKALKFAEVGSGLDAFAVKLRVMGFSDVGAGADTFTLLRNLAFADVAQGVDVFSKSLLQIITKFVSDVGTGLSILEGHEMRYVKTPLTVKGGGSKRTVKAYVE
jgi:hypothetical protein